MTGSAKTREELISSFSSKLFSAMLQEVIMDAALQSHKEILRGRSLCQVCGTRCGSVHPQGGPINVIPPSTSASSSIPAQSCSPSSSTSATGNGIPVTKDGNIYFECTNCQKRIASNRYAPHLSGCLGIGTGSRRNGVRNAAVKNKLGAELDRGPSPLLASDYGSPAHETVNGKAKGKNKNKKINGKSIEANGTLKRPITPDSFSAKKVKKQKTSSAGPSDTTILVSDSTPMMIPPATKIPMKLGASPVSPSGSPDGGSGSQYSGRDSPSASASHSSSLAQSPATSLTSKPHRPYSSDNRPKKGHGPPSSIRYQTAASEAVLAKWKTEEKEDPEFIDVDGEEEEEEESDSS